MTDRWQTILAVDADKHAAATYRANFPGVDVRCATVADVLPSMRQGMADVLLGGPPCQPHSHAGKRMASKDARDCGPDFVAAIKRILPRHFLIENVDGLLSSEGGRYWHRLYASMEAPGYDVRYVVQDAVDFGVPQFRSRLWVWGIRRDLYADGMRHSFPRPTHAWPPPQDGFWSEAALLPGVTVRQALGLEGYIRKPRSKKVLRRDHPTSEPCQTIEARAALGGGSCLKLISGSKCRRDANGVPRGPLVKELDNPSFTIDSTPPSLRVIGGGRNHPADATGAYRRDRRDITDEPSTTIAGCSGATTPILAIDATLDRPCRTISAGSHCGGPEPVNNRKREGFIRRLLPLECARLQSVPDSFIWPDGTTKTAMYKIVGNGWACAHAARFARAITAVDPDARTVIDLFCGGGLGASGWHGRYWQYEPAGREAGAA